VTARWDEIDRYVVISSDAHCGGSLDDYIEYLPKEYMDEFEAWRASFVDPWAQIPSEQAKGQWDDERRVKEMDAEGVAAEILFPNTVPPFCPTLQLYITMPTSAEEYRLRLAGIRAHNRWLKDFCGKQPARRGGLAQTFLNVAEDTVEDIHWAADNGMKGVLVPSVAPNHPMAPGLWSEAYDPVWAACAETGMVANFHAGGGTPDFTDSPAAAAVFLTEIQFYTRRSLWHLILGGVFERHPDLKVAFTEAGTDWVIDSLQGLDYVRAYADAPKSIIANWVGPAMRKLSMSPTEYFARNVWLGASFMPRHAALDRYNLGVDRIMWGTDYPHDEGTYPYTREALQHSFFDVPVEECRMMFGGTAAKVYGFDLEALTPMAAEIGPRLDQVHKPLENVPTDTHSAAFALGASSIF